MMLLTESVFLFERSAPGTASAAAQPQRIARPAPRALAVRSVADSRAPPPAPPFAHTWSGSHSCSADASPVHSPEHRK